MISRGRIDEHQAQMPLFRGMSNHQLRKIASFGTEVSDTVGTGKRRWMQ